MFQTKRFTSIVASMVNSMRTRTTKITDYSVGSVGRTMIEAPAHEIDELYQQMRNGLFEAIPAATYRSFGFKRLPSVAAGGLVQLTIMAQPVQVIVPAGGTLTQTATATTYAVALDTVIPAGNTVANVPVTARTAGLATNLPANTSFTFTNPPAGFVSAANQVAFINGQDLETDSERLTRFQDFISSLARGTVPALSYGSRYLSYLSDANGNITERVKFCSIDEPYERDNTQPPAWVRVFVHNGTGSTSSGLVARVDQVLRGYVDSTGTKVPGYKAAGTHLDTAAATETAVPITGTLTEASGYDHATLVAAAKTKIATYIAGLDIGATCLKAKVVELVMEIPGVFNFTLSSMADVTSTYSVKLMPGTLTIP